MTDPGSAILKDIQDRMDRAIAHLRDDLKGIRTGRATPALVENIRVDYYGTSTPIVQLAQISIPEPRLIQLKPFDTTAVKDIERAILKSDLGLTPQNDGKLIRLSLPPLSEDQRRKLATRVKELGEQARVGLRNLRRDGMKHFEQSLKDGKLSEDVTKKLEEKLQESVKKHESDVDAIVKSKTDEVMKV